MKGTGEVLGEIRGPLMGELAKIRENQKGLREKMEEIEGLKETVENLKGIVEGEVNKVKEKGKKKEKERLLKRKGKKLRVEDLRELMVKVESTMGDKRGRRAKLGYALMYLTGMRIGALHSLDGEWFKENIMGNKEGFIVYTPNKQRGGKENELQV